MNLSSYWDPVLNGPAEADPSVSTPDPGLQSAPDAKAKILPMGKHLTSDSNQPSENRRQANRLRSNRFRAKVERKGAYGSPAAKDKSKRQRSPMLPTLRQKRQ